MKAETIIEVIKELSANNIRIISGKLFVKDVEVKNPRAFLYKWLNTSTIYPCKLTDLNEILDQLTLLSEEYIWPELPIVTEAKKEGPLDTNSQEAFDMPFDIDAKQMMILNILLYHPEEEVMFITTGCGGSGKSTFLNLVKQLFDEDYASVPLGDLNGFMVPEAVSHRLICSDELGKGDLDSKILKTLISKQPYMVNPKNRAPYEVKTQSALFYCCNKAPKVDVTDSGILRRIFFYERNTKIQNPDVKLNHKKFTHEELLWFARAALTAEPAFKNWKNLFQKETHKYLMKDNSVGIFMRSMSEVATSAYSDYVEFCRNRGYKAYNENNFTDVYDLFESWIKDDQELELER